MHRTSSTHRPLNEAAFRGILFSKLADVGAATQRTAGHDVPSDEQVDERGPIATPTKQLVFRLAIHEASHAVIRLYLGLGTITEISIDAPEGGYVRWRDSELNEQTEEFLTAVLASTWAGRAGEETIIESVGASGGGDRRDSDQAVATQIAFDMETAMGFGQRWPLLYRATSDPQLLLALDPELSERVHDRLSHAYQAAVKMVVKQRRAIEHLAEMLLLKGTLKGPELETVIASTRELIKE